MKRNNKGFTLIELLAIIVILAIIAVITVPIILNIIENSRKGAAIDSAYGYRDSIQQYYLSKSVNGEFDEVLSGEFTKNVSDLSDISISGTKPTDGWVTIDKGQVVDYSLKFGDYIVNYDETTKAPIATKDGAVETAPTSQTSIPDPVAFSSDTWATIKKAIDGDNTDLYSIGDTKEVLIDNISYTVRLSNKTFEGCNTAENGFSQTACGFVFEFIDTIETNHVMNSSATNEGGWTASNMYAYLNTDEDNILSKLPLDLQEVIADTYTVSGRGGNDTGTANYTSTSKLYLLSRQEVLGDDSAYDTASGDTKQLEYYKDNTDASDRVKYTVASTPVASTWWLRSADVDSGNIFFCITEDGNYSGWDANASLGVAPTFRIVKSTSE